MKSIRENEDGTYTIDGKIYVEGRSATTPLNRTVETKESVFAEMVKDLERKEDRANYPDSVFWFDKKEGNCMFEHDEKNRHFWCSYKRVWSVFESKFGMKYDEIQAFTKMMVEEHFKCKGVTTLSLALPSLGQVEEHFKCKGVTTMFSLPQNSCKVEEHFKCKGVTIVKKIK